MLTYSPSGALSPYYYKGGYFHGIHYGSYFSDHESLIKMMHEEEAFILKSAERKKIMIDLYETELSPIVIEHFLQHLKNIKPRIFKLSIATDKASLKRLAKAMKKDKELQPLPCYFTTDMEEGKTWLVSDNF